jgi:pSer/pThr/pTyr-binding forkhead associated (FHA) protein
VTPVPGQRMTETAVRASNVVIEVNGMKHPLSPPGIVIGRGNEAELKIDDPGISRRHAQIKIHKSGDETTVTIIDLDSTNGVVLNGHRVSTAVVADGSEIRLGNTVIIIRMTEVT